MILYITEQQNRLKEIINNLKLIKRDCKTEEDFEFYDLEFGLQDIEFKIILKESIEHLNNEKNKRVFEKNFRIFADLIKDFHNI